MSRSARDAEAAVRAAVDRFGRIDVLVNNAASFYAGYFEELTPEQMERQLATSLIGPMNVTRAVLPVMRKQRSGHIISISSSAGLVAGFEFGTRLRRVEVRPRGLDGVAAGRGRAVRHHHHDRQPGILPHRAPHRAIDELRRAVHRRLRRAQSDRSSSSGKSQNGKQAGDPAKLAQALITIAGQDPPPRRFIAGADAIATAEQKVADLKAQIEANRDLSTSLAFHEPASSAERLSDHGDCDRTVTRSDLEVIVMPGIALRRPGSKGTPSCPGWQRILSPMSLSAVRSPRGQRSAIGVSAEWQEVLKPLPVSQFRFPPSENRSSGFTPLLGRWPVTANARKHPAAKATAAPTRRSAVPCIVSHSMIARA